jgi:1-acyl-sn-glycerol-3-phosphate acyltransferase
LDWTWSPAASAVRRAFQDGLLVPALRAYCRPFHAARAASEQHLAAPLLIVANHGSHLDAPAVLAALPPHIRHRTAVAAAADYFYRSSLLGAAASMGIGTFAFARHGRDGCARARDLLAAGWNVLIFPQGSRGDGDGWQPFRAGVGHLLAETGVAALPIGICGSRALWPRGKHLPRRGRLEVHLGQVWQPEHGQSVAAIVAELELRVKDLLQP